MELKPYQQEVIHDLERFLMHVQARKNVALAFETYWQRHPKNPLYPMAGGAVEPYKNNVAGVPHVCVKVPTAGGKTFIACNALNTIFQAFDYGHKKAVVWLVPSVTILEQTLKHLKNADHPYRRKLNAHFANRVEIYDKQALLQGVGFNVSSVQQQLSIFVLSFDSLRARNKEDRKVYQENGNLQSFGYLLGGQDDISLMRVIQALNPVVIVDESHNAETELSVEMLKNLNPCFILDLTATPRKNSNIISFVDALALKKENMVKLPVIVYNYQDKHEVIHAALEQRRTLQQLADSEEKSSGRYIRPIVLFQAQPKNSADTLTFEKIKETLIELRIPEEEIKIKTATINEIKGVDLTSKDCKVRYIITVNALKEGWDCPFAYILASLADRSSPVDVEQVLGRILRQPYVRQHSYGMLNMSYVLTASDKFMDTLQNIVKGLNRAGYSGRDVRVAIPEMEEDVKRHNELVTNHTVRREQDLLLDGQREEQVWPAELAGDTRTSCEMKNAANEFVRDAEEQAQQAETAVSFTLPVEIQKQVNVYRIKETFENLASQLLLPQFFFRKPAGDIFNDAEQLLSKEDLLDGFQLSKADANITFDGVSDNLFKIDLDESSRDHTPNFVRLDGRNKTLLIEFLLHPDNNPQRVKNFVSHIRRLMGSMYPIPESETRKYLQRVVEDFAEEQYRDFFEHEYSYVDKIKSKIKSLSDAYAAKQFDHYLDTDRVFAKPVYAFSKEIIPGNTSKSIGGSLYEREAAMDSEFEEKVISSIAGLPNLLFWTRNIERRQFKINAFINHYPDFILHTSGGKTILLETKGDDRDNSDSEAKLKLGKAWEKAAGNNFKYRMVFNQRDMRGAQRLDEFLRWIADL